MSLHDNVGRTSRLGLCTGVVEALSDGERQFCAHFSRREVAMVTEQHAMEIEGRYQLRSIAEGFDPRYPGFPKGASVLDPEQRVQGCEQAENQDFALNSATRHVGNKSPRGRGQVAMPARKAKLLVRARRRIEQFGQANFDADVLPEPAGRLEIVKHVTCYGKILSERDLKLEMAPQEVISTDRQIRLC